MNHSKPGLPSITNSWSLPKIMSIQPPHTLSSPSPPALNLSQHQGSFQMSQFFKSGGQRIRVSASASVLPMNIQDYAHCSIIHSSLVIETTIFQQVNGLKQCDVTYIGKYYLAIRKRKKSFHLWQHG